MTSPSAPQPTAQTECPQPPAARTFPVHHLATVLGNQVLQRVELLTSVESKVQPRVVGFDMKSGTVVGQGDPPEKGAPILAAAQQPDASS